MRPLWFLALGVLLCGAPAAAQIRVDISGGISSPMPIAVPAMPTPSSVSTAAGDTAALGNRVAEVVTNDLISPPDGPHLLRLQRPLRSDLPPGIPDGALAGYRIKFCLSHDHSPRP